MVELEAVEYAIIRTVHLRLYLSPSSSLSHFNLGRNDQVVSRFAFVFASRRETLRHNPMTPSFLSLLPSDT